MAKKFTSKNYTLTAGGTPGVGGAAPTGGTVIPFEGGSLPGKPLVDVSDNAGGEYLIGVTPNKFSVNRWSDSEITGDLYTAISEGSTIAVDLRYVGAAAPLGDYTWIGVVANTQSVSGINAGVKDALEFGKAAAV
jgi:hypothetical protein